MRHVGKVHFLCSYTYGPLLGLFAFGLLTRRTVNDRLVPYICLASPLLCYALDITAITLKAINHYFKDAYTELQKLSLPQKQWQPLWDYAESLLGRKK